MEWIKVEDRLPENGVEVLACFYNNVQTMPCWVDRYGDWFQVNRILPITNKITHWMPLPEPPKEE